MTPEPATSPIAGAVLPLRRAEELITAAGRSDPSGTRLAQLYIERGYKLSSEDYEGIPSLEEEIALLHGETTGA